MGPVAPIQRNTHLLTLIRWGDWIDSLTNHALMLIFPIKCSLTQIYAKMPSSNIRDEFIRRIHSCGNSYWTCLPEPYSSLECSRCHDDNTSLYHNSWPTFARISFRLERKSNPIVFMPTARYCYLKNCASTPFSRMLVY